MSHPFRISAALAASAIFAGAVRAEDTVQFNRDIRPILTENCYYCHGPDPGTRKEGLRFDRPEGFFEKRDAGVPVVPGNAKESTLVERVLAEDADDIMPPPKSKKKLTAQQKELVKKWVEQGAKWEPHWSFVAPVRPALPAVKDKTWAKNPIDSFILAKLDAAGLQPAPEAGRRTLARRVSLDLTGLPPTPEEVEKFVSDKAPDAYEKFVDALLASPHYGEHRARYWLDAARYADTHGLHVDNYREMWPYRDWVINAFNKNVPFDKFTVEQLAGDLLPDATLDQKIASGFHRCNITTNEGGTIAEENLAGYARDRVETTGETWLGLTVGCAVCHDHKFDPILTKEFYQLSAFFTNTTQGALDGNVADTNPIVLVPSEKDAPRWSALPNDMTGTKEKMSVREKEIAPALAAWLKQLRPAEFDQPVSADKLDLHVPLRAGYGRAVWNEAVKDGELAALPEGAEWRIDPKLGPYLFFTKDQAAINLGNAGDVDTADSFSYGAWVKPDGALVAASVMARMDEDNGFRGWDLSILNGKRPEVHLVNHWSDNALKVSSEKDVLKPGEWNHLFVTYDGSGKPEGVAVYVNGEAVKMRTDINSLKDTIRTATPTRIGARSKLWHLTNGGVQDVRFYKRKLSADEVNILSDAPELHALAASPDNAPGREPRLKKFYISTRDEVYPVLKKSLTALETEQKEIRARNPVTHVMQDKETPPKAFVLKRGQYDQKGDEVSPGVPAALNPLPVGAPNNRLGLAKWIVAPENPLTARVTVNRLWQEVFGTGIVKTAEDFGIMGDAPSHPELLDWLAVEFRDTGWDMKRMLKLIVTSAAYRQSSVATAEKIEKDPANRLLARGPRYRMDAEMVRDYALASSGMLAPAIGGPSVKPYQPEGVWEAVAMTVSNTRAYKQDTGDKLYRRSLYTFWKRAAPPASMEIFNAPSREKCTVRRERTNTPLQALVTLNDPQFIETARHLAGLALKECGDDNNARLDYIASRLLARPLTDGERAIVTKSLDKLTGYYQAHEDDAKKLIAIGESKPDEKLPPPQLAAWTMATNELLNLDEVLNK